MDVHKYTEQFHHHHLNSLCRICGGRSQQKQTKDTQMQCTNYAQDLENVLGVVVNKDTDEIVCSSTMCCKCYQSKVLPPCALLC